MGLTRVEFEELEYYPKQKLGVWQVRYANCEECGALFVTRFGRQVTCGSECRRKRQNRLTLNSIMVKYRSDPVFRGKVIERAQNRRADKLGLEGITAKPDLLTWLFKRDGGLCGICEKPVVEQEGPMRPSIDHIVPIARGGLHVPANVWLAHYRCNLVKHDSLPDPRMIQIVIRAVLETKGIVMEIR